MPHADHEYDVVIIGGGPAGSTAGSFLAQAGRRVLLLEARCHPRPHVGEGLLPGILPLLEKLGIVDEVERSFERKTGASHVRWGRTPTWDLWFHDTDSYDHAWFVDRDRFDHLLFRTAVGFGVDAREEAVVTDLIWDGERLSGVRFGDDGGTTHTVHAPMVFDASGQGAVISRALDLREPIPGLQHQASWAHWERSRFLPPPRSNQAFFVAEAGYWVWHFPMSSTRASVGVVHVDDKATGVDRTERYERSLEACEEVWALLDGAAERVTPVRHVRDWSYRMHRVCGPGWFQVGDAAGFIDPILSQGVFLAMRSAHHAAQCANEIFERPEEAETIRARYHGHHRSLFEDLLRMVRFFYQQNLSNQDYFWESKRVLMDYAPGLKPQKAFLILTSGLVQNLAYDEKREATSAGRQARITSRSASLAALPDHLDFVCLQVSVDDEDGPADLYCLIEPTDPAAPTLFQTTNWHVNCLAPKYGNDPISVPQVAPLVRALGEVVKSLDDTPGERLVAFWRRAGGELVERVRAVSSDARLVRVFGQ